MLSLPNQFYAIEKDGLHRVSIHDEFIGPQTEILTSLAKFVPRILPGIIDNTIFMVNQAGFNLVRKIDSIALHTFYRPMVDKSEKAVMVPCWQAPGSEIKCTWKPPTGMGLFFIQRWDQKDGMSVIEVEPLSYLIARHEDTRRTYLLPLPNLYEDGRICLGRTKLSPGTRSAMEVLEKGIHVLQTSTWNTDLLRAVERQTHALFRFDSDGKQIPSEGDWTQWCVAVNSSNYDFIAKI